MFSNLFLFSKLFIKNHPTKIQMHIRSIQFSSHKINFNPFLVILILPTHLLLLSTLFYWITSIQLVPHKQQISCSPLPSNPICPIMTIELYLWHYKPPPPSYTLDFVLKIMLCIIVLKEQLIYKMDYLFFLTYLCSCLVYN